MIFVELPREVQLIAAQTLSNRLSMLGVAMNEQIEPVKTLAREVREAFIEMYSQQEPASVQHDNGQERG
ncbi:phage protein [Yersinia frederiksenii]|nr:formyltetrahydrofolate deformylase [Yersinia enterocolitica]CNL30382.1 phage protein [Yersinia frederiksenii]CQR19159.1 phage protein [Yersinia enterocolitica]CQR20254.1 phage protein [Yersinia enterocolitica]CRX56216.1 phage protein [Yersinia enterocolitica]